MDSESVLRLGSTEHTSDRLRPIHVSTQNTAGAPITSRTIPMVLLFIVHWALSDPTLPISLKFSPTLSLYLIPLQPNQPLCWSSDLKVMPAYGSVPSGFNILSSGQHGFPFYLFLDCALMSPSQQNLPWSFYVPTLVYFLPWPIIICKYLLVCLCTSLQSTSPLEYSLIRAEIFDCLVLSIRHKGGTK